MTAAALAVAPFTAMSGAVAGILVTTGVTMALPSRATTSRRRRVSFGEDWHGNHHAWPGSERLGLEPGQHDSGCWVLLGLRRLGLVSDLCQPHDLVARDGLRRITA